jgi:hypothetical protein
MSYELPELPASAPEQPQTPEPEEETNSDVIIPKEFMDAIGLG